MRERGIGDLEWVDREGWRKKFNLPKGQKDVKPQKSVYKFKNMYLIVKNQDGQNINITRKVTRVAH